jgi:hypothetical protein
VFGFRYLDCDSREMEGVPLRLLRSTAFTKLTGLLTTFHFFGEPRHSGRRATGLSVQFRKLAMVWEAVCSAIPLRTLVLM